ncbi:MAG: primosomal protein N' [Muribaculum sp.]|nr:primosomal protein N' [Muribaculaceae bacterium]MCM1081558.1 primosomal protein N' [Muribaculum sp.]
MKVDILTYGAPEFVEVIVPKPLYGLFTYSVPQTMRQRVRQGCRVLVQFGAKHYYTGIVHGFVSSAPEKIEVRDIIDVLDSDDTPTLRYPQLNLWDWMADYYLCPQGEVMKAALPAGLKLESDTMVELSGDYATIVDGRTLTERQTLLLQNLDHHGKLSIGELQKNTGLQRVTETLSQLVEAGLVVVVENVVNKYVSKRVAMMTPMFDRSDSDAVADAFKAVKRSADQTKVLTVVIDLCNKYRQQNGTSMGFSVDKKRLAERAGVGLPVVNALKKKGLLSEELVQVSRFTRQDNECQPLPKLSSAQSKALDDVHKTLADKAVALLHGVTSSGKTEIYIHLIDYVLRQGRQVLYLVPEIALTTQLTRRLQRVFGDKVIIYHSKFSDNERVDIWRHLRADGSPCVVLGARSSIFLPFATLGLVIVDEEHESSYKQFDPAPRYNARDCAIVLAGMHGAKTLLGSATPSIETYYKAQTGRYGLVTLAERFAGVQLPEIEIVDTVQERERGAMQGTVSSRLAEATRHAIAEGRQAILFHNRRGFAPVVVCRQCAYVPKCPYCDVSMTYHRSTADMVCHYCGTRMSLPDVCPNCHEPSIATFGYGTERVEEVASSAFEGAKILRMDLDSTRNKDGYENIITEFSEGKAQILVGTQMVTKGLDFGGVSVVGVLNADQAINLPDFRSAERAFNMLEQVAGRAGRRGDSKGSVIVQTSQPQHPVIGFLLNHDYQGFYNHELAERLRYNYPPFTRVIDIYLKHRDRTALNHLADLYGQRLRQLFGTRVYGPEEPYISRIQNFYIRKIMLKVELEASMTKLKRILRQTHEQFMSDPAMRQLIVYYDVDPM